jgi:hypothetical protein
MNSRLLPCSVDIDADVGGVSMTKGKTFFPQVPVEIAEKVAKAESDEHATKVRATKKSSNGRALADHNPDEND